MRDEPAAVEEDGGNECEDKDDCGGDEQGVAASARWRWLWSGWGDGGSGSWAAVTRELGAGRCVAEWRRGTRPEAGVALEAFEIGAHFGGGLAAEFEDLFRGLY